MKIEKFCIEIPQADIESLNDRLARVTWAPEVDNEDWSVGVNGSYLRGLIDYWRDGFDWRAQEVKINEFPQFRTVIDGVPIHFIHVRGKGPNPLPIVLSHGWPWSFWDFERIILPLADPASFGGDPQDAFDVVVPSLPGFGFSGPVNRTNVGYIETADLWVKLMRGLGYKRFVAHGGDAGAFVSARLGHAHPDSIIGVHLSMPVIPGVPHDAGEPEDFTPEESALVARHTVPPEAFYHVMLHANDPQTLAWAMHDSPAGLAAWLLYRRWLWSDDDGNVERRFDKDTLLTHFSLYWHTQCFLSAELFCRASKFHQPMVLANALKPEIPVPTGVAVMPRDLMHRPRKVFAAHSDLRRWTVLAEGGHFGAAEAPDAMVDEIRLFVRPLRAD